MITIIFIPSDESKPLNHFILNAAAIKCLRCIYSEVPKEELMNTPDIMIDFFGTHEKGKIILNAMNDEEWVELED